MKQIEERRRDRKQESEGGTMEKKEEYYFYLNAFTQILDPFVIKEINIIEFNSFEKAFIIN